MPLIQGIVNPLPSQSLPDSVSPVAALAGKSGELIAAELHGKYFTQTYRGNMYDYGTPLAGVTLTTTGSTTQTFGILNPAGSGRLIVPVKACIGQVGTLTVSALAWTVKQNLGTGVAGTSPFVTATFVTALNANSSLVGNVGVARLISTCTLDAAPTVKRYLGLSWGAPTAAGVTFNPQLTDEFDGNTIIGPGSMLFLSGSLATGGATNVSLTWYECPI